MTNYEVTENENPITHFALFLDCNLITFENVMKESKWRKAKDNEIEVIERNDT